MLRQVRSAADNQEYLVSVTGMNNLQLHLNLSQSIIYLQRVIGSSKLRWVESMKIRNPVGVGGWAMLAISISMVVLV
jgi:hypothetical protein